MGTKFHRGFCRNSDRFLSSEPNTCGVMEYNFLQMEPIFFQKQIHHKSLDSIHSECVIW
ncbi:hypothetical protein LEP1GSC043_1874 [Leptospira weilii str. Ecochallenge]|uniref:Uncharacterized protein n=2 Tax=Leptospira weilii TaxID=28184 RepID=N1U951_9LEPT|nr:hypothetical protein LEP1GSC051_4208 [Leptospira sp. P2653]EMN46426.1 hypothetical protein LEP1GSC086_3396 [Leptospira weilii str. LNT 1234]EMN90154.1 hypothetical protein LEP1GSC108_4813 [Leptospira weilii str. UI 13098]EMY15632.1 hypothetical protein LEP1GSC043_1874 [Leptospira weilii str. Ecochallenge]